MLCSFNFLDLQTENIMYYIFNKGKHVGEAIIGIGGAGREINEMMFVYFEFQQCTGGDVWQC